MQAMILAAGFGTRLKPYSLIKPKPLFPVLNMPLLRATINRLKSSGFSHITVNCHYLRNQIIEEIEGVGGVIIQDESTILGTGGGLRQALGRLADEPLLVTNGDIYHTVDFMQVYNHHLKEGADVTMVLHDYPRFNNVSVAGNSITGFDTGHRGKLRAYTGIQVINPDVLADIKAGEFACIIEHYQHLLMSGKMINCIDVKNIFWSDMGTPRDYLALHEALLIGKVPVWPEFGVHPQDGLLFGDKSIVGQGCTFKGWGCVGNASLGDHVQLSRSVVWDNALVKAHSRLQDSIVIPDSERFLQ